MIDYQKAVCELRDKLVMTQTAKCFVNLAIERRVDVNVEATQS